MRGKRELHLLGTPTQIEHMVDLLRTRSFNQLYTAPNTFATPHTLNCRAYPVPKQDL